jgi:hypothetical protein
MKNNLATLCDRDGNLIFEEISMELADLKSYALCLDMLSKRFDENSIDLDVFFHCFREFSSYLGQKVDELNFDYRLVHDYVFEDIPIDFKKPFSIGA